MIRAAMEGVGFSLRHNLQVAEEAGVRVSQLRAQAAPPIAGCGRR